MDFTEFHYTSAGMLSAVRLPPPSGAELDSLYSAECALRRPRILSNKLYLIRKLYQTKLMPDQDMQNYIRSTLEMVERLCDIREDIQDWISDGGAKDEFYRCLAQSFTDSSYTGCSVTIQHVIDACNKQKSGKVAGPDGIAMEAFMHGGLRLQLHLTLLINMFLHTGYLPHYFMQSIIIPLVKSKTRDLADPNNYRAIAISTAMSKIVETVLAPEIKSDTRFDDYQFGFKAGQFFGPIFLGTPIILGTGKATHFKF